MSSNRKMTAAAIAVVGLLAVAALVVWDKTARVTPQPGWITSDPRDEFLYGSIGLEEDAGVPYWIWLALPRLFPEYLPGPGGYASLGLSWEETREMPAGLSKRSVGYVRVAANCALCHAYSRSNGPDAAPTVFAAGTGHTAEVQKVLAFYRQCAQDPRFNADDILDEVSMSTTLSLADSLAYRYVLIPRTRERMLHQNDVLVDAALWRHSQDAKADPSFVPRLKSLSDGLQGAEKAALLEYLQGHR